MRHAKLYEVRTQHTEEERYQIRFYASKKKQGWLWRNIAKMNTTWTEMGEEGMSSELSDEREGSGGSGGTGDIFDLPCVQLEHASSHHCS